MILAAIVAPLLGIEATQIYPPNHFAGIITSPGKKHHQKQHQAARS
jgi:hypothetical protein